MTLYWIYTVCNQKKNYWKYTVSAWCIFTKVNKQKVLLDHVILFSIKFITWAYTGFPYQKVDIQVFHNWRRSKFLRFGGLRLPETINWAIEVDDLFSNFNASSGISTLPIRRLGVLLQLSEVISVQWSHSSDAPKGLYNMKTWIMH